MPVAVPPVIVRVSVPSEKLIVAVAEGFPLVTLAPQAIAL